MNSDFHKQEFSSCKTIWQENTQETICRLQDYTEIDVGEVKL